MSFAEQWGPAIAAVVAVIVTRSILDAAWWVTFLAVCLVALAAGGFLAKRKAARSESMRDEHPRD